MTSLSLAIISAVTSNTSNEVYYSQPCSYAIYMNEQEYRWHSPDRDIPVGTLVRFVEAPPRYEEEDWRDPGEDLLGTTAIILSEAQSDSYNWGGRFSLHTTGHGYVYHWGDFLEIVQ